MIDTSTRLLRLLSVLQSRCAWAGPELAQRLEVTARTLRRDIDRLRSLGYSIAATSGPGGGYSLGQGDDLPPLLLDDEEAVALAAALRSAVDSFTGLGDTAMRLLVKLDQLLPSRLRRQVGALQAVTVSVGNTPPKVDPDLLTVLAAACRDRRILSFPYRDKAGKASTRTVEPLQIAHSGMRHWYLVAWDLGRADWRTLRVDRIPGRVTVGKAFIPRPPPADIASYVTDALTHAPFKQRARVKLKGSLAALSARVPAWCGVLEPLDSAQCLLSVGAETAEGLAIKLLVSGADFELIEPQELAPALRTVAARLHRGAGNGSGGKRLSKIAEAKAK
jgi:predicted DNA-binding transcriptional regulator YafY